MPTRRTSFKVGHPYEFVCLQIRLIRPSKLKGAEKIFSAAKTRFHEQVSQIVATYHGQPFTREHSRVAFLFAVRHGREVDAAVCAALQIPDCLARINGEFRLGVGMLPRLSARICADSGQAVYHKNSDLITGDFLRPFLDNERELGPQDTVIITERVHRQLAQVLRQRFAAANHSQRLGCRCYRSIDSPPNPRYIPFDDEAPDTHTAFTTRAASSDKVALSPSPGLAPLDRKALVGFLTRLAPSDFAMLVTLVEGAAPHVSRSSTIPEQVAELIRWAESSTGPGLAALIDAVASLRQAPQIPNNC
jgi:hypothetical protein